MQEPVLRERLRGDWERHIERLQIELLLARSQFEAYKTQAAAALLSGLQEVRRDALSALTDQAAPFDLKRGQMALVSQDEELTQVRAGHWQFELIM